MFASTDESTQVSHGLSCNTDGCRGTRTPKGIPAPAIFKIVSSSSQITPFFLSTVVNRRTFSHSRLKDFYKSPHDSYHDYKRNNFSNLQRVLKDLNLRNYSTQFDSLAMSSFQPLTQVPKFKTQAVDLNHLILQLQYIILS